MKRFFLLFVVLAGMLSLPMRSMAVGDKAYEEALRKSELDDQNLNPDKTGYPCPFVKTGSPIINPDSIASISTGYYFVDSDVNGDAGAPWRPDPAAMPDVTYEPNQWVRILSGPNQRSAGFFSSDTNTNGLFYFRNPAPKENGTIDSTDDAVAGPMPLRFEFFFNGMRYDSFYVSTNGLIGLTNRRYTYTRNAVTGKPVRTGYDKYSMDWFVRGRERKRISGKTDNNQAINDNVPDNYGYISAFGPNPTDAANFNGGLRVKPDLATPAGALNDATLFPPDLKQAIIAPMFSDLQVSVFSKTAQRRDDFSQVWFKRSVNMDSLTILFSNILGVHEKIDPNNPTQPPVDLDVDNRFQIDENTYVAATFSVVMTRLDSSVSINFHNFDGSPVMGRRNIPPELLFRYNSTIGVRGFARQVNWNRSLPVPDSAYPWAGEYEQYTHYAWNYPKNKELFPYANLAIKFKQYRNIFRVVDIQYRVKNPNPNAASGYSVIVPTKKAEGYELLAGDTRLGSLQPVVIIQNLSNDIQGPEGVNYIAQPLQFTATFKVINDATEKICWTNSVTADSLSLSGDNSQLDDPNQKASYVKVNLAGGNYTTADLPFPGTKKLNGIPPYGFAQIFFAPFSPHEAPAGSRPEEIGRLKGIVSLDPFRPGPERISFGELWPFDNTRSVSFFALNRLDPNFYDDGTHFHMIGGKSMPSTLKWVNYEGEVIDGEDACYYPLSPRGEFVAANKVDFDLISNDPIYDTKIKSPVIKLNRKTLANGEPDGWVAASNQQPPRPSYPANGDELRSFPIDMRNLPDRITKGASVAFSLQRGVKKNDGYDRNWADQTMLCPEMRAITNQQLNTDPVGKTPWTDYAGSPTKFFDAICLEFASTKVDATLQTQKVVNINDDADWRWMPYAGETPVTDNSAYMVYGGGGYQVGYSEKDGKPLKAEKGVRCDIMDDGVDYDFKRCIVPIPDTIINAPLEGAKNFRFRFKVRATDGKDCGNCIDDDDDPFLIDNVKIVLRRETADLEVSSARILWPYAVAPVSQAIAIPVKVKVSNNSALSGASDVKVVTRIYRKGEETDTTSTKAVYCRLFSLPYLKPGSDITIPMPNWDARGSADGEYVIKSIVYIDGGDADSRNDTTTTDFSLKFGDCFSYIKNEAPAGTNDVINESTPTNMGRGLSFPAYSEGGFGTYANIHAGPGDDNPFAAYQSTYGCGGFNMTGEIAMKFELFQADTIHGFNAFFAGQNRAQDQIEFQLYTDAGSFVPSGVVNGSNITKYRGRDDKTGVVAFDKYTTYLYKTTGSNRNSIVLPAGTYWLGVTQSTFNGFMLGASKSRSGMRTTMIHALNPQQESYLGTAGVNLIIDKDFRITNIAGKLINNNCFAQKTNVASSSWTQFFPTSGNPSYPHLDHFGTLGSGEAVLARGSWIPLLRPYFGTRSNTIPFAYQDCPKTSPVEIFGFKGQARSNTVDLYWNTATEINNKYFVVERKLTTDDETAWRQIGTVNGAGNSVVAKSYVYNDSKVKSNTSYSYRLTSVENDGKYDCAYSNVVTVELGTSETTVSCGPNPFSADTKITINSASKTNVVVEISDIFGNIVKSFNAENVAGEYTFQWNGDDQAGNTLSSGTYIYKAKIGNDTFTGKLSLVR